MLPGGVNNETYREATMKLIFGLGNPGNKYKNNRHNAGFAVVDGVRLRKTPQFTAIKSDVFMNDSGSAIKKLVSKSTLRKIDLYVAFDDLDIPLGSYKIQKAKGPKDHNGLNSIYEKLGTEDFWHIRVGVDNRDPNKREKGEEYVLQDFSSEEKKILDSVIKKITNELSNK